MKMILSTRICSVVAIALLGAVTFACYASGSLFGQAKIDFEFTGQVLDFDTKEPIEGAYALAVYEKVDFGFAASARYCVKTKGMTTGKDGRFHFPIDKLDGNSPVEVVAIKGDYYFRRKETVSPESWKKQNKETYSNRNVYLKKQDPAKPSYQYGASQCGRPESREAAEANIRFFEIELDELDKYGVSKSGRESQVRMIKSMKSEGGQNDSAK